jgi:hypothetical protein
MLAADTHLNFLRDKIMQVNAALCSFESDLPPFCAHMIETEKIDDKGYIYFTMAKEHIKAGVTRFPVKMIYHRKELKYSVEVEAQAFLDKSNLKIIYSYGEDRPDESEKGVVHLKAKILHADYIEYRNGYLEKILGNLKKTFSTLSKSAAMLFY